MGLFFELHLSIQEQNWSDAFYICKECATLPLPVAHRAYLVAVAFKAISASDEARVGVDGCHAERWCRVGMEMVAAAEDKRRFATVLARVSLAAGKWEVAKAAARVMKSTPDRWILAVLSA